MRHIVDTVFIYYHINDHRYTGKSLARNKMKKKSKNNVPMSSKTAIGRDLIVRQSHSRQSRRRIVHSCSSKGLISHPKT